MIADVGPLEAVFQAYRRGSVYETQDRLADLKDEHIEDMRGSVAILALQDHRAKMLEMCLSQGGFQYEVYFIDEADRVQKSQDPETIRVLEQSELWKRWPRFRGQCGTDDETARTFDVGGKLPVDW